MVCPGNATEITPPQTHISLDVLLSEGWFASGTVGEPGTQGAGVFGMHGIGVKTPNAAAVADATAGLATLMHTPNGITFTIEM